MGHDLYTWYATDFEQFIHCSISEIFLKLDQVE